MKAVLTLMKPRLWAFLNGGISRGAWDSRARLYFFSAIGLVFWLGIYMMFYRVLTYFKGSKALATFWQQSSCPWW